MTLAEKPLWQFTAMSLPLLKKQSRTSLGSFQSRVHRLPTFGQRALNARYLGTPHVSTSHREVGSATPSYGTYLCPKPLGRVWL